MESYNLPGAEIVNTQPASDQYAHALETQGLNVAWEMEAWKRAEIDKFYARCRFEELDLKVGL